MRRKLLLVVWSKPKWRRQPNFVLPNSNCLGILLSGNNTFVSFTYFSIVLSVVCVKILSTANSIAAFFIWYDAIVTWFEKKDWLLFASTFFIWLNVFPCALNALIPIFPSHNGFVWHILQQNIFSPVLPENISR